MASCSVSWQRHPFLGQGQGWHHLPCRIAGFCRLFARNCIFSAAGAACLMLLPVTELATIEPPQPKPERVEHLSYYKLDQDANRY